MWAHFPDLCVQKWSCLPWNSDAFWKFSACEIYRKSCGRNSTICGSKNEAVCCEVQTHFGSFRLSSFVKKFWVHFYDLCVQKRNCLPWNSDAFRKFSACKFYRKSCGRNSTICASKNEAICREIQTHSGRSLPARFTEKIVGAIPRFVRPKTKLFAIKFRHILEFFACKICRKSCGGNSTICASKNEAVCCEFQTQFGSFRLASFVKKVLGAFSQFMCPKTKLFAVKFRRILEFLALQGLWKELRCIITICASKNEAVCRDVQTHSVCFPLARLIKKLWAHFHDSCAAQTNVLDFNIL